MKFVTIVFVSLIISNSISAQTQAPKLAKNDKIMQLAYNDTTKALALLFIERRTSAKANSNDALVGAAISTGVVIVGGAIMLSNTDSPEIIVSGLVPVFVGIGGVIYFAGAYGISKIKKNAYTLRKFERLVKMSKEGKPIPVYYLERAQNYFR